VSPVKEIAAQAKFDKLKSEVQILSVDSSFFELSGLDSDIDKGRPFKKNEPMSIVIAESLAQLFDTNGISPIGKTVRVDVVMDVEPTQEGGATTMIATRDFRVIGILGGHMENVIYMHSNNFQEYTDIFSMVKIETVSSDILQEVRGEILKKGFAVSAISDTVEQANQIFGVITTVLAIFGAIALAVSAIGMFNTMTITLLERTPEIGVMKSIGASKLDVVKLFITEALIMGFLGSVAGVLIGIITAKIVNITFNSLAIRFGGEAISVFYTPPLFIVLILIGGSFIGLLTGVFPARRASKIDALNALRYK
jgi:putative ABC transport system permease protein